MKTPIRLVSLLAAAFVAVTASGGHAVAQDIKIGTVLSATGPASFLGSPEEKTLRLYVDKINAAGGVLGKKIALVVYDDGADPTKARTFATRLIEVDKVTAMVGGTTTGTSLAMAPIFEDAHIPFISLAGAVEIIEPVRKYVFKTPQTDRMACEKIFGDLKARKLTKIGMISGTDAFGKSMHDQCLKIAGKYGISILADESYGAQDSDMTPQLTNIKNKPGIQAVVNPGFGQGPAIVTRNYRQLGITVPLYESHGVASKSYIKLAGPAAEGVRLPADALLVAEQLPKNDPQRAVDVAYKQTYEKATGEPVSTFGGHAYDGLFILVNAMKRARSTDPAKVRDEIEKTKHFIGTDGIFNMSPTDHLGLNLAAFRMLEIRNGDWKLLQAAR
ncbi:MAG: ABC transporter substrate-binding protein [Alphaproteobacteria bacterium]|nr:ABC transporter substrate-binding protein [Alphaproteobacteria bacterium]